jgi:hypothetical protein
LPNTKGVLDFALMEQVGLELQHINVKLLLKDPGTLQLDTVVPVFHRWIQGQVSDELLLDVADYGHVPDGPGVVLIGHEADYAVDNTDGLLGVRYNRKAPVAGNNRDRLRQALLAALGAAERLRQELKWNFNGRDIEIVVNDRILAPNCEETRLAAEPEFKVLCETLFSGEAYGLKYPSDSRRLFGVAITAAREFSLAELVANVGTVPA